jgi:hypothetical protein
MSSIRYLKCTNDLCFHVYILTNIGRYKVMEEQTLHLHLPSKQKILELVLGRPFGYNANHF